MLLKPTGGYLFQRHIHQNKMILLMVSCFVFKREVTQEDTYDIFTGSEEHSLHQKLTNKQRKYDSNVLTMQQLVT